MIRLVGGTFLLAVLTMSVPCSEAGDTRWDLGVNLTTVPAHRGAYAGSDAPTKWVPGIGGWATFRASDFVALEAEVDGYSPGKGLGLLGATPKRKLLAVGGLRLGASSGPWSAALKVRPGVLRSNYDIVVMPPATSSESDFVIDVGGVFEHRGERWLLRLDVGDLWIPSDKRDSQPFDEHNLRVSLGVGLSL